MNTNGFHIEQAGFASWTRAEWMAHDRTIIRAAYKAALRCRWYKIPPRILDAKALLADFGVVDPQSGIPHQPGSLEGGIVTHATISQVYHESTHTDPGPEYPLDYFHTEVLSWLKGNI